MVAASRIGCAFIIWRRVLSCCCDIELASWL
jgi:hypothetical protein